MAVVYFDSSAFVKLLVEEDGSDIAARVWADADLVVASRLAYPEVRAALSAARRGARLDRDADRRVRRGWDGFWSATRVVELSEPVAVAAADLAGKLVLGGADAVHLATALTLMETDPVLVTWDLRLHQAAGEAGLRVAPTRF